MCEWKGKESKEEKGEKGEEKRRQTEVLLEFLPFVNNESALPWMCLPIL